MTINKKQEGTKVILNIEGRLDTTTAPELEAAFNECLSAANELELDFKELEYVSSAGLRVLLNAQKQMGKKGGMVVRNVNEMVMEVFEVTGFVDILTIE